MPIRLSRSDLIDHPVRPPYRFHLDIAEAVVLQAWLRREIAVRGGLNVAPAMADPSEGLALRSLAAVLAAMPRIAGSQACLGWARALLDPHETSLPIDARGTDLPETSADRHVLPPERESVPVEITMSAADLLVLFEFLCREIDEADGANLLASFVTPAEFWALNNLQCVLEKGEFYSVVEDYSDQLDVARARVVASKTP